MNPPSVVATVPALFDTALPIASHPGAQLTGASVLDLVSNADTQIAAIRALQRRLSTRVHLTCMDLSAEAEAFGCPIGQPSPDEVPTVLDRCVANLADARSLPRLRAGDGRTGVQIQTVTGLVAAAPGVPVIACATGPFSLAARLLGVSEALILTASPSPLLHAVLRTHHRLPRPPGDRPPGRGSRRRIPCRTLRRPRRSAGTRRILLPLRP